MDGGIVCVYFVCVYVYFVCVYVYFVCVYVYFVCVSSAVNFYSYSLASLIRCFAGPVLRR
jgi:hypothetical protein